MAMRVEIAGLVPGMIMMFAGHFLLALFVAVTVGVKVTRLMTGMVMVLTRLFLWHCFLLQRDASLRA